MPPATYKTQPTIQSNDLNEKNLYMGWRFWKTFFKINRSLLCRGYPINILLSAQDKVRLLNWDNLLESTATLETQENSQRFFPITSYHPEGNILKQVISTSWDLLSRSCATRDIHDSKIIYGHSRNKNLRDLLVKAKVDYHPENALLTQSETAPLSQTNNICKTKQCRYCPKFNTTGYITSSNNGRQFHAKKNVTCKSHNVIYSITCNTCKKQYVGQTKRRIIDRFQGHFYTIAKGTEQIGRHFSAPGHKGILDVSIHILSFIYFTNHSTAPQS